MKDVQGEGREVTNYQIDIFKADSTKGSPGWKWVVRWDDGFDDLYHRGETIGESIREASLHAALYIERQRFIPYLNGWKKIEMSKDNLISRFQLSAGYIAGYVHERSGAWMRQARDGQWYYGSDADTMASKPVKSPLEVIQSIAKALAREAT